MNEYTVSTPFTLLVDFPHVMAQLGKDAFDGNGWEVYDRGERVPPAPKTAE